MEFVFGAMSGGLLMLTQPMVWAILGVGVIIGMLVGAMPGIGPSTPIAVLLPFTFGMPPENAILLFVGIFVGANLCNSYPAVLLRTPGTASAIMQTIDGYEMHRQGKGGKALGIVLISSVVGQLASGLFFIVTFGILVAVATKFLFPEMFALAVLALVAVSGITGKSLGRAIVAIGLGVGLGTIGPDPITGHARFAFGNLDLQGGPSIIALLLGLLAVSELLFATRQQYTWPKPKVDLANIMPTRKEFREFRRGMTVGTIVGLIVGILPAIGPATASFLAYQQAKLYSKDKARFGKGSPDLVASVDAANNACVGGDLVPTLALGVPGSTAMLFIMAALIINGIIPGPGLARSYPGAIYATVAGLIGGALLLFPLGLLSIRPTLKLMSVNRAVVLLTALTLTVIGVYAQRWSLFDVGLMLGAGFLGYVLRRYGYPLAPVALGLFLGPMLEENLRRGLAMEFGSWVTFFTRPYTVAILFLALISAFYPMFNHWLQKRHQKRVTAAEAPQS